MIVSLPCCPSHDAACMISDTACSRQTGVPLLPVEQSPLQPRVPRVLAS
jgi:hypothetical protein